MHRPLAISCMLLSSSLWADETRDCADCAALEIEATYTGEIWNQASGGVARGTRYLDDLDLMATADGGELLGLPGLQIFGYALYNNGQSFADLSGTAQGISNIEADAAVRLYELWSQWDFGQEQSLRFGLYDVNSEFDSIDSASLFINPSHGIGPDFSQSGYNGPSIFPVTSLGIRALHSFDAWSVQAAILDGVPGDADRPERTTIKLSSEEGALLVGELNYRAESGLRIGAGYWRYTADFDDLYARDEAGAPRTREDNAGVYAIVESPLLLKREANSGLNLYLRLGTGERHINPIENYIGAGAVYRGLLTPQRDQVGIAVAIAELGTPFRRARADEGVATHAREYDYEITYRLAVNEWLALQADAQYVDNPGMDPTLTAGWAFGLRLEVSSTLLRLP